MKHKKSRFIWAATLVLLVGFTLKKFDDYYFEISKNVDIFTKLLREIHSTYVEDVEPNQFVRTGIDAMLKTLDPYTQFISASEIEDYRFMSTGQYGGIGAVISKKNGKFIIVEPYIDSPAMKAGLRAGDELIQVDNEKVENSKLDNVDVRNLLRGQPKTKVKIIVRKPDQSLQTYFVERDEIKIKNVPFFGMIDNEIGYIQQTGFTKDAAKEVKYAYEKLKSENPSLKGIILDLRGNPGGLLMEAIDIANFFIPKGEKVVETKGKMENANKVYTAKNSPIDTEIPLAVIINEKSASASEIVSGVMQDLDRSIIVGRKSFGKGLVQTTRPLSYNTQLKVTTAKYYTPSGRCIQAIDYAHRDEEGSAVKIPDSLKKAFKTKAGRTVYDGGGIEPDLTVEEPKLHKITEELLNQFLIFDFATQFVQKNPQIPSPDIFQIDDKIYQEFTKFVESKSFVFSTNSEKELDQLIKRLQDEGYNDLNTDVESIRKKIMEKKQNDILKYKHEIIPLLQREIVARYYFGPGVIQNSFLYDKDIQKATAILKNPQQYRSLLKKQ